MGTFPFRSGLGKNPPRRLPVTHLLGGQIGRVPARPLARPLVFEKFSSVGVVGLKPQKRPVLRGFFRAQNRSDGFKHPPHPLPENGNGQVKSEAVGVE